MKILITGFPGTGKSSVAKELKKRGHNAYDIEAMPDYAHVEDRATGRHLKVPSPLPLNWFSDAGINRWDINKVTDLLNEHDDVFICGLGGNQDQLYDYFDRIFVLTADDTVLEQRLR